MSSGDLSVFWQEIIDSYRDIMVVKNSPKAKDYLDLTDAEHTRLSKLAEKMTAARLSYHVSILESAMADMQRAFNSKRSIAEIALTRMCDAKSAQSPEALALRIEELEKSIAMLKLGIGASSNLASVEESVTVLPTVKAPAGEEISPPAVTVETKQSPSEKRIAPYGNWIYVIEKIGELKHSLASRLKDAKVYKVHNGPYLVRLSDFFAKMISSNAEELAILRGMIAEAEGVPPDAVEIAIEPLDTRNSKYSDELDDILN
jgi:DNA polymerase III gamma/tau subunit